MNNGNCSQERRMTMTCPRCEGHMNPERFYDFLDGSGNYEFVGWRCVNCGEIVDPVIAAHRQAPRVLARDEVRAKPVKKPLVAA